MHETASSLLHSLPTFSVAPGLGRSRDFLHDWNRLYKLNGHGEDGEEEGPGAGAGGGGESTVTGMEEDMTTEDDARQALLDLSKNSGHRRRQCPIRQLSSLIARTAVERSITDLRVHCEIQTVVHLVS